MSDIGDVVTVNLLVDPYDESTTATLLVTKPDGSTVQPVASSEDDGNTWSAPLTYDMAGSWIFKWSVSGTGASVEYQEVSVAPAPTSVDPNLRVYATTIDLANFLRAAPPVGARKMLEDASRKMTGVLLTAVYAVDEDGMPSSAIQAAAIAEATCAIVEWWMETGGDTLGAEGDWVSASAGGVSISREAGSSTVVNNERIPWKAWNILMDARVLPGVIYQR